MILENKLRREVKFDSFSKLKIQIEKDIQDAKLWHENAGVQAI